MRLAIIGAGAAGLAAARSLRAQFPGWAITVYEKSRGFGGRVATRRREGYVFDHGAQVFKGLSETVAQLLTNELPSEQLRRMELPTWSFDGAGTIQEGDAAQNAEASFFYASGNNQLGKLLAEGLDVRREVRVAELKHSEVTTDSKQRAKAWTLIDDKGNEIAEADALVLTAPAPQIVDILNASELDETTRETLNTELGQAQYRRCLSLALAYDRLIARPFYALVNNDRKHPLVWLALEHSKGESRCPPGHSLLIAQMAPDWSSEQYSATLETLTPQIAGLVGALLGEDLDTPLWADLQRWRFSQPDSGAGFDTLNQIGAPHGLFFAGDYSAGKGRVHLAIEQGWRVADLISSSELIKKE